MTERVSFFEVPKIRLIALVFQKRGLEFTEKFSRRFSILMLRMANSGSILAQNFKKRSQKLHIVPELSLKYLKRLKKRRPEINLPSEESSYIELIKKDPSDVEAYRKLGDYYIKENNLEDAGLTFRQILKLNPDDEGAKERLGEIRKIKTNMPV